MKEVLSSFSDTEHLERSVSFRNIVGSAGFNFLKDDYKLLKKSKKHKRFNVGGKKLNMVRLQMLKARPIQKMKIQEKVLNIKGDLKSSTGSNPEKMTLEMCEIISTISRKSSKGSVCTSASKANHTKENNFLPEIRKIWMRAREDRQDLLNEFSMLKL